MCETPEWWLVELVLRPSGFSRSRERPMLGARPSWPPVPGRLLSVTCHDHCVGPLVLVSFLEAVVIHRTG